MHGRVLYLRNRAQAPSAGTPGIGRPLDVVVLYTNPAVTAYALTASSELARDLESSITLMAVHVLPYPSPLETQEGVRQRLETDLKTLARTSPAEIRAKLVFARDRTDACLGLLRRRSMVVIGTRKHWWRTREERLARRLAAHGHSVALIRVE